MSKQRIRVTLGAWVIVVTVLCVGVAVAILVVTQVRERKVNEAKAICVANLARINALKEVDESPKGDEAMTNNSSVWIELVCFWILNETNCFCPLAEGTNRSLHNSYAFWSRELAGTVV